MPKGTVRVVARLMARPERATELRDLLSGLLVPTRLEAGCITYELLQNQEDPTDLVFVEEWQDGPALEAHFETDHIRSALAKFPDLLAEELDVRRYVLVG